MEFQNKKLEGSILRSDFYNVSQKREYLYSLPCQDDISITLKVFRAAAPMEQELDMDCCSFPVREAERIVIERFIPATTCWRLILAYYNYCKWCIRNKLCDSNVLTEVRIPELHELRLSLLSSASDLHFALNEIFEDERKNTVDVIGRALMWVLYSGVELETAVELTAENVDLKNREIHVNGKTYKYSKHAAYSIRAAATLDELIYQNNVYTTVRPRGAGDKLFRAFTDEYSPSFVRYAYLKKLERAHRSEKTIRELSSGNIWRSGICDMLYQDHKAVGYVDIQMVHDVLSYCRSEPPSKANIVWFLNVYAGWFLAFYSQLV